MSGRFFQTVTDQGSSANRVSMRLVALIALLLLLDVVLTTQGWLWSSTLLVAALAVPLFQVSLLAMLPTFWKLSLISRFAVPTAGALAGWFVLSRILPWGFGDDATAGWALAIAIQVLTIVLVIETYRRFQCRGRNGDLHEDLGRSLTFGAQAIILWTTVCALGMGFIQYGRATWQWSIESVWEWEFLAVMPLIGVVNGVVALMSCWIFNANCLWRVVSRMVIATIAAVLLAALLYNSMNWMATGPVLSFSESLVLVTVQSVLLSLSVLVLRVDLKTTSKRYLHV